MNKFFFAFIATFITFSNVGINTLQAMKITENEAKNNQLNVEKKFKYLNKTTLKNGESYLKYRYREKQDFIYVKEYNDLFFLGKNPSNDYCYDDTKITYGLLTLFEARWKVKKSFFDENPQYLYNPFVNLATKRNRFDLNKDINNEESYRLEEKTQFQRLLKLYDQNYKSLLNETMAGSDDTPITLAIKNKRYLLAAAYIYEIIDETTDIKFLKSLLELAKQQEEGFIESPIDLDLLSEAPDYLSQLNKEQRRSFKKYSRKYKNPSEIDFFVENIKTFIKRLSTIQESLNNNDSLDLNKKLDELDLKESAKVSDNNQSDKTTINNEILFSNESELKRNENENDITEKIVSSVATYIDDNIQGDSERDESDEEPGKTTDTDKKKKKRRPKKKKIKTGNQANSQQQQHSLVEKFLAISSDEQLEDFKINIQDKTLTQQEIQEAVDYFQKNSDLAKFITFFAMFDKGLNAASFLQCQDLLEFIKTVPVDDQINKIQALLDAWITAYQHYFNTHSAEVEQKKKLISVRDNARNLLIFLSQKRIDYIHDLNDIANLQDFYKDVPLQTQKNKELINRIVTFNKNDKDALSFFNKNSKSLNNFSNSLVIPQDINDSKKYTKMDVVISGDYAAALLYAIVGHNLESVDYFLNKIQDLETLTFKKEGSFNHKLLTFIFKLFSEKQFKQQKDFLYKIIQRICNHNTINKIINTAEQVSGVTPLHFGVILESLEISKLLIKCGAEVNATDKNFAATPLHYAANHLQLELAKLLIEKGARIDSLDNKFQEPYQLVFTTLYHKINQNDDGIVNRHVLLDLFHTLTNSSKKLTQDLTTLIVADQEDRFKFSDYFKHYPKALDCWIEKYGEHAVIQFIVKQEAMNLLSVLIKEKPALVQKYLFKPYVINHKKILYNPSDRPFNQMVNSYAQSCKDSGIDIKAQSQKAFDPDLSAAFDLIYFNFNKNSIPSAHIEHVWCIKAIENNDTDFIQKEDDAIAGIAKYTFSKEFNTNQVFIYHDYYYALLYALEAKNFDLVCYFLNKIKSLGKAIPDNNDFKLPLIHLILRRLIIGKDNNFACQVMNEIFQNHAAKFNINVLDQDGNTLLHIATNLCADTDIINLILEQSGIDVTIKSKADNRALDYLFFQLLDEDNNLKDERNQIAWTSFCSIFDFIIKQQSFEPAYVRLPLISIYGCVNLFRMLHEKYPTQITNSCVLTAKIGRQEFTVLHLAFQKLKTLKRLNISYENYEELIKELLEIKDFDDWIDLQSYYPLNNELVNNELKKFCNELFPEEEDDTVDLITSEKK